MAPDDTPTLEAGLARYLGDRVGHPVAVSDLRRIPGGASRATYRFVLNAPDGKTEPRRLVLRIDPAASLIETERALEYAALEAFFRTAVPVPQPLWLEADPAPLGAPFFVMAEILDCEASPLKLMALPYAAHREAIGHQKWTILGTIAATDPVACGLAERMPAISPAECWQRELGHWQRVLDADQLEPQPIQQAAIRWLARNPPPPAQRISVLHGDFRTGNILVDRGGTIRGIVDWEMVHLGDPLEDLAWGLNRVWCFNGDDLRGGLLTRESAIAVWQRASGLTVDADALRWWEVFTALKGQAIWLSAAREFQCGQNRDSMMALAAWMQTNSQDRATLELLGRLDA